MKNFEFENWDEGRVQVNQEFTAVLKQNGLTTFNALMDYSGGETAKNVLAERVTTRIDLTDTSGASRSFYIKRHTPAPMKEYLKAWSRLRTPLLSARYEWEAILNFHQVGISTMIPVAFGEKGRYSFLITESLEDCWKLSHWVRDQQPEEEQLESVVKQVAEITRKMHSAGMHHQDYYLGHLMLAKNGSPQTIHVIDLGRVLKRPRLHERWIVKDLAQLRYSASMLDSRYHDLFVENYFERSKSACDQALLQRIKRKTEQIARHSQRHAL
ncbi:Lipopolysaccharide core heptose(I) kinase RfaP [Polystyrenella longa]|uniref:Lipopolysaccharide core heptose(I) kinase RfaP n=1 Tax=Polystyrenella longa TaxID=2528007 RepID=A0A518CPU1_9PLAN|nr:lipopolysaccharide kinase InaA family protein [Polystyrenella longa]QDU81214.1 Lipopolysaccharide core heptose(I) kinase RfaP [Polystyrenella longa]